METRCIRCGSRIAAGTRTCAGCGWQAEWAETFLFALTPAEGRMLEALQEIAQTALTETEEIMRPVIGFDFGNYNSYVCFVSDPEPGTIREGVIRDLVPDKLPGGIPSVFYHSRRKGTHVGEAADRMKPVRNQMRYLKLHLGEQVELDGDTISCDDAVVQVAQHCLQKACREMQNEFRQTTNLVALAYPARYNQAQRNRLIELIEQTETEDGQPFRVVGTIMEPAAASLSYLYENSAGEGGDAAPDREVAALAFDVGGGTFDLSLLRLYPAGRERADGSRYNYEILDRGGILDLGGKDFDRVLLELLLSSLRSDAGRRMRDEVQEQVERIKRHLTDHDRAFAQVYDDDEEDYVDIEVTRPAFEEASAELIDRMVRETERFLQRNAAVLPDIFLLTGGACQMPMIRTTLEKSFPALSDRITVYRPEKAIAYGAARFALAQETVLQRINRDIGIRFYESTEDKKGFISTYLKAGTEIPGSGEKESRTLYEGQKASRFRVYEATTDHPDPHEPDRDYKKIMEVYLRYGEAVPVGTDSLTRLTLDAKGTLSIRAWVSWSDEVRPVESSVRLLSLSADGEC